MGVIGKPRLRPDVVLTKTISCCVAADESLLIKDKAHELDLTVSQFMRLLALGTCDVMGGK